MSVMYVDSVSHSEKELASTSFGHKRTFNSLCRALSTVSQVWGRMGLKTCDMNNLLATFCFFAELLQHTIQAKSIEVTSCVWVIKWL